MANDPAGDLTRTVHQNRSGLWLVAVLLIRFGNIFTPGHDTYCSEDQQKTKHLPAQRTGEYIAKNANLWPPKPKNVGPKAQIF